MRDEERNRLIGEAQADVWEKGYEEGKRDALSLSPWVPTNCPHCGKIITGQQSASTATDPDQIQ